MIPGAYVYDNGDDGCTHTGNFNIEYGVPYHLTFLYEPS